ncbi:MAG: putative glycosyltransferase YkoT [Nitrospira sp.]|jgi:glycosyltransferase involved in cell wall biosynthesis|nr:MAG: putative glycosyltransferase YkoT [Nitrospira sp.]
MSDLGKLAIIIPCYNEQEVLPETCKRIRSVIDQLISLKKISSGSRVFFVDDGSKDRTWSLIEQLAAADPHIAGIKLSRNRGHQNALIAGLFTADGDAIVSIDADLQDDVNAIEIMVDKFIGGAEIVYGVRNRRESDTAIKRITAEWFYRMLSALGAESIYNHADYRLMSRRVVECMKQYPEVNLYLRGIVPLIGFRSEVVCYDRIGRFAGESKYPLRKMVALALDAVTSFSVVPLRIITYTGFFVFAASMIVTIWALWVKIFTDEAVPGWTSTVLPMYLLGGIQILCIGVIGEYLGKTYIEIKSRPRFFIEKIIALERNFTPRSDATGRNTLAHE